MKMPSTLGHKFSEVPHAEIQRSQFNRSFGYKTTFDAGWLIPFYCDEALPGDTFQLSTQGFARLATPLKPIMDNMFLETFFFAVPYRLVWDNFKRFMGEQANPGDSTDFQTPVTDGAGAVAPGSLLDYMGVPLVNQSGLGGFVSLHLRAYNLIYNEFFRDENIQNSAVVDRDDGPDDPANYPLKRRGKRHDYFTSCLPFPQKGVAVTLPLGISAPVRGPPGGSSVAVLDRTGPTIHDLLVGGTGVAGDPVVTFAGVLSPANQLLVDLTQASSATINELRQAFQLQKLLERDARGGTRYTEKIKAHFGVTSPDARLQRPEYLGGGSSSVTVSPIAQTSVTAGTPQGNLAAIGTASFGGHGFVKSFTEHTLLIGLMSVRADLTYQQGLERMWSRRTQYDFYWPALAHIGEQAVLRKELFMNSDPVENQLVFGYQERYAEYRYKASMITGMFRSQVAGTMDVWHLAQRLDPAGNLGPPATLSPAFIVEDPPIDRVIAVPSEPHFIFDSFTTLKCARPMPMYGVPGLIDHF